MKNKIQTRLILAFVLFSAFTIQGFEINAGDDKLHSQTLDNARNNLDEAVRNSAGIGLMEKAESSTLENLLDEVDPNDDYGNFLMEMAHQDKLEIAAAELGLLNHRHGGGYPYRHGYGYGRHPYWGGHGYYPWGGHGYYPWGGHGYHPRGHFRHRYHGRWEHGSGYYGPDYYGRRDHGYWRRGRGHHGPWGDYGRRGHGRRYGHPHRGPHHGPHHGGPYW
mmetsp:Transcript_14216/g.20925  ORF Transcript_14216/g.20925 Transcript_14216/m.20925 type:complete len:220 (+) Transcript_14216:265-924(+)